MVKDIQAIVFDFDGVLAESVKAKGDAFYALYQAEGSNIQQHVLDYHLAHGGVSRFDKIRYYEETLLGRDVDDETIQLIASRFGALVEDNVIASQWVKGAQQFLEMAKAHCQLYVASATPQAELERIIAAREMKSYFKAVYGSPVKKADHIRQIIEDTQLKPEQVMMIGDTMSDYNAAQATSINFIGRIETKGINPFPASTTVIDDLTELPQHFRF